MFSRLCQLSKIPCPTLFTSLMCNLFHQHQNTCNEPKRNFNLRNLRPIDRMCAPNVTSWKKINTYTTSADKPIQCTASWYFHHHWVLSATWSQSVTVFKRLTSLVLFSIHLVSSEILFTNRKISFRDVCYYENLNRGPRLVSFSVSPGFTYTLRLLEVDFRFSNGGGRVTVWVGKAFKQVYWCVSSSYIPSLKSIYIVQRFFVINYCFRSRKCSD
jgi:hypothetical protein